MNTPLRTALFAILVAAIGSVIGQTSNSAIGSVDTSDLVKRQILLSYPTPPYPLEARAQHMTGAGVFEMQVAAASGRVTSVKIVRSTGFAVLDNSAVNTLGNWKFRPNTALRVRVPIAFSMRGGGYPVPTPYAPPPNRDKIREAHDL